MLFNVPNERPKQKQKSMCERKSNCAVTRKIRGGHDTHRLLRLEDNTHVRRSTMFTGVEKANSDGSDKNLRNL